VRQQGSRVEDDRLRFDFSHHGPVEPAELARIEQEVNERIWANIPVETREMPYPEALQLGAKAFFSEKYGDRVRVVFMSDYSIELCGGTHVRTTGQLGLFRFTGQGGVAAGVRRIEAVTGEAAIDYMVETDHALRGIAGALKATRDDVEDKVRQLVERSRRLEKEVAQLKDRLASGQGRDLAADAAEVAGVKFVATKVEGADAPALRNAVDQLKNKLGSAVVVLGSVDAEGKVLLIAGVTPDLTAKVKAGDLVNHVARQVGGKGGGRPDLAQAGGTDSSRLDEALAGVTDWLRERLA
jgi:alanyl-tRNA synthetase